MTVEEIRHLATLARIAVTDEEALHLAEEFESILGYVAQVTDVAAETGSAPQTGVLKNVMRKDVVTNEPGMYTEALLAAAPIREGQYVRVKKILGNNNAQ